MDERLEKFRQTKLYDVLMALPLIAWFGRGAWQDAQRLVPHIQLIRSGQETTFGLLQSIAVAASIGLCTLLILVLLVRTVPRTRAGGIVPRIMAVVGTFLGTGFFYVPPVPLPLPLEILSVVLIIVGAALGFVVVRALGRSFSVMPEARELVTSGPYRIVRHPLYVVEAIGVSSLLLQRFGWQALALYAGFIAAQVARAHFEEQVLAQTFPQYRDYAAKTARFIPFVW